jgi:nucleotide-binding universal stress UspA family protein
MVVVDSSPAAQAAIEEGVALARVRGAEVLFFHVLPRCPMPMVDELLWTAPSEEEFDRLARADGQRLLGAAAALADRAGVMHRCAFGKGPDDATSIVEAARRRRCDLVVVASEGRNALMRLMTGSVIPGLITSAPMPVMVCKGGDAPRAGRRTAVSPRSRVRKDKMAYVAT